MPHVHVHRTRTRATIDTGTRLRGWCFCCRGHRLFAVVVHYPDSVWYGPDESLVCLECRRRNTNRFGAGCTSVVEYEPAGTPIPPLSDLALEGA